MNRVIRADGEPIAWAASTLLRQGMPADEVSSVLRAGDSETIRRYLELHRERLAEQLSDQLRAIDRLEWLLTRFNEYRRAIGAAATSAHE
jgi:hypothetical protein